MATIANAFNLLTGAEQQLSKKKKKANKPKQPETNGAPTQAAPAPVAAPVPAAPVALAPNNDLPLVVGVHEACAIFERAAREARTPADKVKLWREWTRLANDKASKLKYADAEGVNLDFKQVVLRCKALEICAEGCISAPLSADKEAVLSQMLASFLPNDKGACNGLANLLVRLSNALSGDAPDTLGAAQRAVNSLVQALKSAALQGPAEAEAANPVAAWLDRVAALDRDISRQATLLQKLRSANKGTVTRETSNTARDLVRLQEEKYDLLQPEAIPAAKGPTGALGACLRSVEELKAVISGHLKDADSSSSGLAVQHQQQQAAVAAASSYKREEEILSAQAVQVAGQIRTLEAQLQSLRSQAAEIEEKRAMMAQRQRAAWQGNAVGKGGRAQAAGAASLSPAHYREALVLAESLADLADPRRSSAASPEQVLAVQTSQVNCPVDYVAAAEQLLGMALQALAEVPAKLTFCRQRVAQASKLAQLGAMAGPIVEEARRNVAAAPRRGKAAAAAEDKGPWSQLEEAQKLMTDTLGMAEDLVATAAQVRTDTHKRYDSMARFNPEKAAVVAAHVRNIDALAAQVQQQYTAVQAAANGTAPPAPAVPAQSPVPAAPAVVAPASYAPMVGAPLVPMTAAASTSAAAAPSLAPAGANGSAPSAPTPAPKPAPVGPPPRQWAKPLAAAPAPSASDDSLPTPAEAFKGPSTSDGDGFKAASKKKNRQKA